MIVLLRVHLQKYICFLFTSVLDVLMERDTSQEEDTHGLVRKGYTIQQAER